MAYKNPEDAAQYQHQWYLKNKEKHKQRAQSWRENNPDRLQQQRISYKESMISVIILSLISGIIQDVDIWSLWFNRKSYQKRNIIYDMSSKDAFELMKLGCYYCGELALTLDRLDSTKEHTTDNCVGCCVDCNSSKGALDPKTFILQAVYRQTFIYYGDFEIWHKYKTKPSYWDYQHNATKQNRLFELTKDQFEHLIRCPCHYCKRTPEKYFGIDKLFPDDGYVAGNVVTACSSCNRAKWDQNPEDFSLREMRITQRYLDGVFDELPDVPKNISHHKLK